MIPPSILFLPILSTASSSQTITSPFSYCVESAWDLWRTFLMPKVYPPHWRPNEDPNSHSFMQMSVMALHCLKVKSKGSSRYGSAPVLLSSHLATAFNSFATLNISKFLQETKLSHTFICLRISSIWNALLPG